MSEPETSARKHTVAEVPIAEIDEALKSFDTVWVKVMRRNDKGQFAFCEKNIMQLKDLLDVENYLRRTYGGGTYFMQSYHVNTPTKPALTPFTIVIEGLSLPVNRAKPNPIQGYTADGLNAIVLTSSGPIAMPVAEAHAMHAPPINQLGSNTGWQPQPAPDAIRLQMEQMRMQEYMAQVHHVQMQQQAQAQQQAYAQAQNAAMVQAQPETVGDASAQATNNNNNETKTNDNKSSGAANVTNPMNPYGSFGAGMSPALQYAHGLGQYAPQPPAPGATMASDQALLQQIQVMKQESATRAAEHAALVARLEAQAAQAEAEKERLQEENEKRERAATEERHRLEMKALTERFELMFQQKNNTPAVPTVSDAEKYAGIAAILGAIAPVIAAMVSSGKEASKGAIDAQAQTTSTMLQFLAAQSAGKKDNEMSDMLKALAPIAVPLITAWMANKSPENQANLIATVAESSMQNMSMMSNFIQEQARSQGDGPPWWAGVVANVLDQLPKSLAGMAAAKAERPRVFAPPAPQPRQLGAGPKAAQEPIATTGAPVTAVYTTMDESQSTITNEVASTAAPVAAAPTNGHSNGSNGHNDGAKPDPELLTQLVMSKIPEDFRRPEWERVIFALHDQQPVEEVAQMTVALLGHLMAFDMLPEGLKTLLDDPRATLGVIVQEMPVMSYATDYVIAVVEAIAVQIEKDLAETDVAHAGSNGEETAEEEHARLGLVEMQPEVVAAEA